MSNQLSPETLRIDIGEDLCAIESFNCIIKGKRVKTTMLSDKQIQEVSQATAEYSSTIGLHPFGLICAAVGSLPLEIDEMKKGIKKCKQWLFDNQQSYPFSITKQDMLY